MSSPRAKFSRHIVRWYWPAAMFAFAPKCALCLLAYAGIGAAFGLGGPEICGSATGSSSGLMSFLPWLGLVSGIVAFCYVAGHCRQSPTTLSLAASPVFNRNTFSHSGGNREG